jgi:hypothetical protein
MSPELASIIPIKQYSGMDIFPIIFISHMDLGVCMLILFLIVIFIDLQGINE